MRVEYRIEPCKSALTQVRGHAVPVVAQPVHGLRAPLHVLLRPPLRAACRPPVGRPLRPLDPREAERRRGSATRARAPVVGARRGRSRNGDGSVPARRGQVPPHARVPRRARRRVDAVLDRHPRAARRARHRRAAGGVVASRGRGLPLAPHARRARLADDRARHGAARKPARGDPAARRGRHRRRRRDRADPSRASPTTPRSSRPSSVPRAPPARGRSGRASSTCARGCASTSSRRSRATGPRRSRATRRSSRRARTSARRQRARSSSRCDAPLLPLRVRAGVRPAPRRHANSLSPSEATAGTTPMRAVESPSGRRDHLPHRGRPRGRSRGPSPRAVALAAHPRDRRGVRRRVRGRARRAAPAGRRDHGSAHARHGRARGDRAAARSVRPRPASSSSPRTASARSCSAGSNPGARGYILKEAPHETLLRAIEKVAAGETFVDPGLMAEFVAAQGQSDVLTPREREILQLLADGMSNADVAAKLFISQETVKSHVRHILAKLEADTRTQAVAIALREAMIDLTVDDVRASAPRGAHAGRAGGAQAGRRAAARRADPAAVGDLADARRGPRRARGRRARSERWRCSRAGSSSRATRPAISVRCATTSSRAFSISSASRRPPPHSHGGSPPATTSRSTSTSGYARRARGERGRGAVPDPSRGDGAGGPARAAHAHRDLAAPHRGRRRGARRRRRRPARTACGGARGVSRSARRRSTAGSAPRCGTHAAPRSGSTCRPRRRIVRIASVDGNGRSGFLFFVWSTSGYTLVERSGDPPRPGHRGRGRRQRYRVTKIAPSPLPGDPRPCAYLLPA